ncbi:MAG TPA: VCBS repeat-containing protein, partial [Planctomycetota bacterium]|nr:VCBS repeat-containing protein [Planctomycetota bacterium]
MRSTAAGIPFALALLSSSAAAQGPVPGFEAPPIAIPGGPGVFTGGDLNGDSFEDLVVAMTGSSGAVALLGSAGGLGAPSPVVSGTAVFRVLLADANHDGKLDLFFVTPSATRIALGVGNGTFGSPASVATTSLIPAALAAGDLDLDGDLDVVLADGPGFSFVLGDGSGGFGPKTTVAGPVGALPRNLALADLDHDGDLDVVTTVTQSSTTDRLAIYLGDGSGGFAAPSVASIPGLSNVPTLALGDLNGDGTLDSLRAVNQLAVMLPILPGRVEMRLGDGAGGFGAIAYAGSLTNGAALEARDVTNDGLVDVAYVDGPSFGPGPASCSWLIADGAGGLGPETRVQPSVKPSALLLDDLTHDGRIDLVTTDSNASTLHVLAGDGAGHFGPPTFAIGVQPRGLVTSDFDRDGRPDVAVASRATTSVSVLLGTGSGFLPKTDFAAGAGP